jgi:streptogramin lyase
MTGTNTSGSADGTNSSARFNAPVGIALDAFTNVYVADFTNNTIRKLTLQGTNWAVTTIAGHAGLAGSADGTNATAQFFHPSGITIDGAGTVYVTDSMNNTIRKVKPFGTNWVVTTLAGSPGIIGSADGTGKSAQFYSPNGVTVDSAGKLYVADSFNATVRLGRLAILLNLTQSGNKMILSWPMGATGYLAEASSSLSGANWNPVTGTTVTDLDTYFITNTPAGPAMFYRLIKP